MTSEIDKLKHFHVENYSGTNFTDDLNDGEEFLYTTIRIKDDKEVHFYVNMLKINILKFVLIVYLIIIFAMVFYVISLFLK
nr:MAG: hypothetical protein [Bacteriophage sp.]